jgi:hypothetical protein
VKEGSVWALSAIVASVMLLVVLGVLAFAVLVTRIA